MTSARYTYLSSDDVSYLIDRVNDFCKKYPEYRLMQIMPSGAFFLAILTTDPIGVQYG